MRVGEEMRGLGSGEGPSMMREEEGRAQAGEGTRQPGDPGTTEQGAGHGMRVWEAMGVCRWVGDEMGAFWWMGEEVEACWWVGDRRRRALAGGERRSMTVGDGGRAVTRSGPPGEVGRRPGGRPG